MKSRTLRNLLLVGCTSLAGLLIQCGYLNQFQKSVVNLQRCKFKLQNVADVKLAGISIANKHSVSDFGLLDGAKLAGAYASKKLIIDMTLNVAATNPNDGTGGTSQASATLVGFPWKLLIDNKETISGDIGGNPEIPGKGQTTIIPLVTSLDLYQFFADKGYDNVVNLALSIGGASGSAARLTLRGTPRISTPLGNISYPQPIDVVDKEFRN